MGGTQSLIKLKRNKQMETSNSVRPGMASRWAVLALLALGVLISFVDRTSISSTLADPGFVQHFALTDIDRGWINAAFFWSYGVFQVPMGWVADRYGVKWPYAISFALWCIATALMGAVTALASLVVMRLIIGMAEAIVIPASYRWIRNNFDESQNGLAVGILAMGNKFGPAIGAPVGAWFIVNYSWKMMFIATGLVGLLWLIPWLLMVRNDLPTKAALTQANRSARTVTFGSILSSPVVWGGMVTNFCYGYFTSSNAACRLRAPDFSRSSASPVSPSLRRSRAGPPTGSLRAAITRSRYARYSRSRALSADARCCSVPTRRRCRWRCSGMCCRYRCSAS
jgi:ACS family D-galactonate transporter-like MFS transporter